jgi:hypothetical protein
MIISRQAIERQALTQRRHTSQAMVGACLEYGDQPMTVYCILPDSQVQRPFSPAFSEAHPTAPA